MKYRCTFPGSRIPFALMIEAPDALSAAEAAAHRNQDVPFSAVEVWQGTERLLTLRRDQEVIQVSSVGPAPP